MARWLAGCHTRPYCINTAKAILKLFRPAGSPIILVSSDPAPIPNSSGNPFSGGVKYTGVGGWENLAIFDRNRRLSRKRCEIGRWLLWNVNRKSWVSDRTVSFSMTFSDPKPGFQGHCILPSRISQNRCVLGTIKLLKNTNRKSYTIYLMVPHSMTLSDFWPGFQGHDIFEVGISEKRRVLKTKLLFHTDRKLYLTYLTALCSVTLTWLTSKSVARVCQHPLSFLFDFIAVHSVFICC